MVCNLKRYKGMNIRQNKHWWMFMLFLLSLSQLFAHPSPNSLIQLTVGEKGVEAEIQLPLSELELATRIPFAQNPEQALLLHKNELADYVLDHFRPHSLDGSDWKVALQHMEIQALQQVEGKYFQDLVVTLFATPPDGANLRHFLLNYDGILHQIGNHKVLVSIKQDWAQGIVSEGTAAHQLGLIQWDIVNNKIPEFEINMTGGSDWKGFKAMFALGVSHIAEGLDHLLFLLVLLLSALQFPRDGFWQGVRPTKTILIKVGKIVTAFTLGHSLTLALGTFGWVNLPQRPIEVLIALSISITAFHAIRPIFPNRETLIAGLFGLVHGLAFAFTLKDLHLEKYKLLLSLLGFNLGVESFQLFIVVLTLPLLLWLTRNMKMLALVRKSGAVLAFLASVYWIGINLLA
ncbi:HupE/UreJ family protein [Marinilongibacter aquaticus]|uniref:HupE/UreJ family protein n=1 Tax=Marinilongibacter aquaticus TaxID=2975157 RepID=UPI0021BDB5D0|nr:HupE/UreJ family protein [Marinilongibacter aquaticus]UBM58656.1 HupE/UreJ family protein [Marinilongibacter aquaticus]